MTGFQIYNAVWSFIWFMLAIGGIYGIFAGNPAHWGTTIAALIFVIMLLTDSDGEKESLKDLIVRKFKERKRL